MENKMNKCIKTANMVQKKKSTKTINESERNDNKNEHPLVPCSIVLQKKSW